MFRELLQSRGVVGVVIFFVLIISGSLLYFVRVHRTSQEELARTKHAVEQLENKKKPRPVKDASVSTDAEAFKILKTPTETYETQSRSEEEETVRNVNTDASLEMADAFLPEDIDSEKALAEDVRVSSFGFGPYPEVPADYPEPDIWDRIDNMTDRGLAREVELMERVCIKLWNQGIKAIGASFHYSDGKIYPTIPGVAYVKWKWEELPDGTRQRYASRISGPPELVGKEHYIYELGIAPPGITIIDYEEGGIDPYEFLNLQR